MDAKDLSIMIENVKLNIRVGVILEYNNKILVEKNKKVDFGVITGGRIRTLESGPKALVREVEEESGIKVEKEEIQPFFLRKKYYRDYPEENSNSCYEYHYYVINTDKQPDLSKVNYTEAEKVGKFELRYIPLSKIEEEFEENKKVSERTKVVEEENLEAIKIYKKM